MAVDGFRMLRIGEVARRAGVSAQTLRYYERRGLLPHPARRPSGYREYTEDTVGLVRFIRRAQDLGFSLQDVGELIELRRHASARRATVRAVAERKLADITGRIRQLTAMQRALEQLVRACGCAQGSCGCPIIEALGGEPESTLAAPRLTLLGGSNGRR